MKSDSKSGSLSGKGFVFCLVVMAACIALLRVMLTGGCKREATAASQTAAASYGSTVSPVPLVTDGGTIVCDSDFSDERCVSGAWINGRSCACMEPLQKVDRPDTVEQVWYVGCASSADMGLLEIRLEQRIRSNLARAFVDLDARIRTACVYEHVQERIVQHFGVPCGSFTVPGILEASRSLGTDPVKIYHALKTMVAYASVPATLAHER